MSRLRIVPILLIAGLGCLLAALLLPGTASADENHDVEVSVAGDPFTSFADRPLLDVSGLAPGESTAAVLGVRSRMESAGDLYLRIDDVHDNDGGCVGPEQTVDTTCGRGDGDLGRWLVFTVATSDQQDGQYVPRWAGSAAQLARAVKTNLSIASGATQWVRMTATLPAEAGRAIESDTFRFAMSVIVRGKDGTGGAAVGGKHTHRHHGSSGGGSPLANTGVAMTLLAGVGVLLVVVGLLVLATAWRRSRTRSAAAAAAPDEAARHRNAPPASDQGRHRAQ